jgi:predicted DNA-binding transcriptional regulator AlpA
MKSAESLKTMPPSPMGAVEKILLTVEEAAFALGISASTIRCGISRRARSPFPIKPVRINGSVRFDKRDILAFIDSIKEA